MTKVNENETTGRLYAARRFLERAARLASGIVRPSAWEVTLLEGRRQGEGHGGERGGERRDARPEPTQCEIEAAGHTCRVGHQGANGLSLFSTSPVSQGVATAWAPQFLKTLAGVVSGE
eukprot:3254345-Pleurochrysis_carterae.AAC.1